MVYQHNRLFISCGVKSDKNQGLRSPRASWFWISLSFSVNVFEDQIYTRRHPWRIVNIFFRVCVCGGGGGQIPCVHTVLKSACVYHRQISELCVLTVLVQHLNFFFFTLNDLLRHPSYGWVYGWLGWWMGRSCQIISSQINLDLCQFWTFFWHLTSYLIKPPHPATGLSFNWHDVPEIFYELNCSI